MKKILSILLTASIILSCVFLCSCGKKNETVSEPAVTEPEHVEEGGPNAKPGEEGEEPEEEYITVSLSQLKQYAATSTSLWEFLQRFFKDTIVYKDAFGKFQYEPVNKDLPLSDYDWSSLETVGSNNGTELQYVKDGETVSIKGIDVSKYQGDIDWAKVAGDGVKFAMIRMGYRGYSEGALVVDPCFEANVKGALENDIAVGVYFYTQSITEEEAREDAQFIINAIKPYRVTWPVVYDLESVSASSARAANLTKDQRTDIVIAFCEEVKTLGYRPMLYSNIRWFIEEMDLTRLTDYDKWFAQYFNQPFFPYAFQMWQYTSSGVVDGIEGGADLNISFVDYGALDH